MPESDLSNAKLNDHVRFLLQRIRPGGQFGKYHDDPVGYANDILGVVLTPQQEQVLNRIAKNESYLYRLAVRSGHATGKSFVLAILVNWFIDTRPNAIIATTAPTWRQVKSVLWREINRLRAGATTTLPGTTLQTELYVGGGYAIGFSTDDATRFQGLHAEHILVIEDESPGVHPLIHDAIEGVLSGGGIWVKVGNPTSASGSFYECFTSPIWDTMHLSCLDHPNVVNDKTIIPGAVSKQWCEDRLRECGLDSPMYQSRVLGNFPTEGEDQLISLGWVEQAFINPIAATDDPRIITCDVARFGTDNTVIGFRRGSVYTELESFNGKDLMQTTGRLKNYWDTLNPDYITVDDDGLGGGVTDRLSELGVDVRPFKGGSRANDSEKYFNKRAEAWWTLREAFRSGDIHINEVPEADEMKAQLTALSYDFKSDGRIYIESKKDAKRRGIKSPDRGDSMAMAFTSDWFAQTMAGLT